MKTLLFILEKIGTIVEEYFLFALGFLVFMSLAVPFPAGAQVTQNGFLIKFYAPVEDVSAAIKKGTCSCGWGSTYTLYANEMPYAIADGHFYLDGLTGTNYSGLYRISKVQHAPGKVSVEGVCVRACPMPAVATVTPTKHKPPPTR